MWHICAIKGQTEMSTFRLFLPILPQPCFQESRIQSSRLLFIIFFSLIFSEEFGADPACFTYQSEFILFCESKTFLNSSSVLRSKRNNYNFQSLKFSFFLLACLIWEALFAFFGVVYSLFGASGFVAKARIKPSDLIFCDFCKQVSFFFVGFLKMGKARGWL